MEDDRLGRIALRLVDRAGLIHAVVRTDGARTAQVISESLPALLESLSQRGLPSSWALPPSSGSDQPPGSRPDQQRRQRQSPHAGSRQAVRAVAQLRVSGAGP
jgi:hypothetical protein